ncbi:hypothetical protein [Colwellia psychrerythraea]|uniref:Lipoprotein n=1 Tax=Colwellia psychrerythraea TaxID=28229 RepID=A0A099KWH6_COLPS|nr:hypothetical protein [Colwellia psychrerythraea]KGJ94003.1 hypothetical protein GAB14E_2558 [Colwellia psychrerythraea]
MKFTLYSYLLSLCVLSGCSNISSQNNHHIVNDVLESSYQDIDNSLSKRRSNLLFNNDEVANNCNSYFLLNSKYDVDESVYNQQVKSEYLICDALEILLNSSSVTNSIINDSSFGEKLASKLDLRTFPSSLHRAGTEKAHTLKSIFPEQFKSFDNVVEVETEDWAFTIEAVAMAKINDNSLPDWIVWVLDESKSGNYRGYSTLIIYDPEERKNIKATVYPQVCGSVC